MNESYRMSYLKGVVMISVGLVGVLIGVLIALPTELEAVSGGIMDNFHNSVIENDKIINTM